MAEWAANSPMRTQGELLLLFASDLDVTKDPEALELAITARRAGWRVLIGQATEGPDVAHVRLRSAAHDAVSLHVTDGAAGLGGIEAAVRFQTSDDGQSSRDNGNVGLLKAFELPPSVLVVATASDEERGPGLSVADLFGDNIMLRDFEPRADSLDGIDVFRRDLGWDSIYVPRKNEPEYARALLRIMGGADANGPEQIVYVGDTLLNDGGAIRGLQAHGPRNNVWGFLCGATKAKPDSDFALGQIYFGAAWISLVAFLTHAQSEGLVLDERAWVLFDLDQTVYAAKDRDDEPLVRARWDAARAYLEQVVPGYKFDASRAEALYREFDRDDYHPVTRDNLDYVVLLVLAVASGLADATEIRDYASSSRPTIAALAEELRRRASMRVGHEDIAAVLDAVKAVYYNTLAGDQTPCKDFRRLECLAMAARMRGDVMGDIEDRIVLNREVVDVIRVLQRTGAHLFAVSDRPLEAAVALPETDDESGETDLMTIRMLTRGVPLSGALTRLPIK